jgi:hypothetical protein
MKLSLALQRRLRWLNLPTLSLLALLQRTPVVRVAVTAGEFVLASPLGAVLKSAVATAASLGAVNSLAGATEVQATQSSPVSATIGTPLNIGFFVSGNTLSDPERWTVGGTVPPGTAFSNLNAGTISLSGTPTTAGSYSMQITAIDDIGGPTPTLNYTVNVAGASNTAPAITTQPQSQTVVVGANVTFTAAASGTPAPTFQWRKNTVNISGQTAATLTLNSVQLGDAGSYTVVATNSVSSVTSNAAVLTVNAPPAFTTQPQSQTVSAGANVTFTAAASGTPTPTYQWKKGGTDIAGQTGATLTLNNVQAADAATYTVVATNSVTSTTSSGAVLTVNASPTAPAITTQPQSQTVVVGANVTLTAAASGTPTPTFQWKKGGTDVSGATSATLTLNNIQLGDAGSYTVVATNSVSTATSNAAVITVNAPPAFTTQPQSQTVVVGATVTFTAAASGTPAPTLQWKKGGVEISGQTGATLTLNNVQVADAGSYTVVATNAVTSTTSSAAVLTVNAAPVAPAITTQPQSQTVLVGANVTLTAAASGTPTPTFQWKKGGTDVSGATGATLTLNNVQLADAGSYTVVATNSVSSATSNAAVITVNAVPPTIVTQPAGHTLAAGSTVVFAVEATGTGLTYQWKKGAANVTGATSSRLILANVQAADAASYSVTIGNTGGGSVTSSAAVLSVVTTADPGRIFNLSIRGTSGTGNKVLIMGFVAGGDGTGGNTSLLIRGAGPSIIVAPYFVTDALPDPVIQIIPAGSSAVFASNDNWGGTAQLKAAATGTGAFPFISDTSKDAALLNDFPRNLYSVIVSGNGAVGPVLAEIYDANISGPFNAATPRLVNISARAFVGGTDTLTAGFVLVGQTARTVLIRAVGPDPTFAGNVGNANIGDPRLAVYHAHDGTSDLIATNDNWGGDAQLTAVGTSVGAAVLTSATSKDAVVLITLDPGVYSAQAVGVAGSTGITLIEVYEVY